MTTIGSVSDVFSEANLHDGSAGMSDLGSGNYMYSKAVGHTCAANYKYWIEVSFDDGNASAMNGSFHGVRISYEEIKY